MILILDAAIGSPSVAEIGHCMRMSDIAGRAGTADPLAALPRVSWFPRLSGYCSGQGATYVRHELDDQPPVQAHDSLDWREDEDAKPEWSIVQGDTVRALTPEGLDAVAGGLPVPHSQRLMAERPTCSAGSGLPRRVFLT
jgi:hypothetical protein